MWPDRPQGPETKKPRHMARRCGIQSLGRAAHARTPENQTSSSRTSPLCRLAPVECRCQLLTSQSPAHILKHSRRAHSHFFLPKFPHLRRRNQLQLQLPASSSVPLLAHPNASFLDAPAAPTTARSNACRRFPRVRGGSTATRRVARSPRVGGAAGERAVGAAGVPHGNAARAEARLEHLHASLQLGGRHLRRRGLHRHLPAPARHRPPGPHPSLHHRPSPEPPSPLAPLQPHHGHHPLRPAPALQPPLRLPPEQRPLRRHPCGNRQPRRAPAAGPLPQQPLRPHPLRAQQPHLAALPQAGGQQTLRQDPQPQHRRPHRLQRLRQHPQWLHPAESRAVPGGLLRREPPAVRHAAAALQPLLPLPCAGARHEPQRHAPRDRVRQKKKALRRGNRRHRRGCRRTSAASAGRHLFLLQEVSATERRGEPRSKGHGGGGGAIERRAPDRVRRRHRHDVLVQGRHGRHVGVCRRGRGGRCGRRHGGGEPAGVPGEGRRVQLRPGGPAARVGGGAGQGQRGDVVQGGAGGGDDGGGEAAQGRGGGAARVRRAHGAARQGGAPEPAPGTGLLLLQGREAPRLRLPPQRQPLRHAPREPGLWPNTDGLGRPHALGAVRLSRPRALALSAQPRARQRQVLQRAPPARLRGRRALRLLPPPDLRLDVHPCRRRRLPCAGGRGHAPAHVEG